MADVFTCSQPLPSATRRVPRRELFGYPAPTSESCTPRQDPRAATTNDLIISVHPASQVATRQSRSPPPPSSPPPLYRRISATPEHDHPQTESDRLLSEVLYETDEGFSSALCEVPPWLLEVPPAYDEDVSNTAISIKYSRVSAGLHCAYLIRSDGIVDRTTRNGLIQKQMIPEGREKYVAVSAGEFASYLLRSDGCILRTTGGGKIGASGLISPPSGLQYVGVSAGPLASHFVRSDGAVDRYQYQQIGATMKPKGWPKVRYTVAYSGMVESFFIRNDGVVDCASAGKVKRTVKSATGAMYLSLADCVEWSDGPCPVAIHALYLVRSDGVVERVVESERAVWELSPPPGVHFVDITSSAGSTGAQNMFLVRSDGKVERITGSNQSVVFESDVGYICAAAGPSATYLTKRDGTVERIAISGKVRTTMVPIDPETFAAQAGDENCTIL